MSHIFLCKLLGHRWKYKDYGYTVKSDGTKFKFSASRLCTRCDKKEYKFETWIDEKSVPADEFNF